MYTFTPRTAEQVRREIHGLKRELDDIEDRQTRDDIMADLDSLYDELDDAEQVRHDRDAPTGGLDLNKVVRAFGAIPKDWDEGFL